jgi:hypothetical protein
VFQLVGGEQVHSVGLVLAQVAGVAAFQRVVVVSVFLSNKIDKLNREGMLSRRTFWWQLRGGISAFAAPPPLLLSPRFPTASLQNHLYPC